ncbi:hypothetical protein NECAME_08658 [Necator americanus]|uniref:Peptidase M13 C-terminal domain-containing protein n=1 Tax=Necator americanus TaxID=51031 RepID=W2TGU4_NECAM|nr:hypothetical protein NECAME_08658 [Necator americanus]ETN81250.1 hypothetical protein NECAME_08658 [Necator americanus]
MRKVKNKIKNTGILVPKKVKNIRRHSGITITTNYIKDKNGIEHDENGNPRTFNKNDWLEFTKGATCLEELYSNSSIPGTDFKVNGFRTLSENIADVEGIKQSFMAYKNYQKEKGYRKEGRLYRIEDIAADQLFFLGHAFKSPCNAAFGFATNLSEQLSTRGEFASSNQDRKRSIYAIG